mmetsp:Transcript_9997/g.22376  ORF Transcript_9997/g.22376 Transcript_9997/m.22376 type:complete len:208 (+) Transcript_9997:597-1220(+)
MQERTKITLVDTPYRVYVCGAAVILGVIASQGFIDIGRTEHKKRAPAWSFAIVCGPAHNLRHEVRHHHTTSRLDVLQGEVLRRCGAELHSGPHTASSNLFMQELRILESLLNGRCDRFDGNRCVICTYLFGEPRCPALSLGAAVLRGHVARDKNLPAEILPSWRSVRRSLGDLSHVSKGLGFAALRSFLQLLTNTLAHDANQGGSRR